MKHLLVLAFCGAATVAAWFDLRLYEHGQERALERIARHGLEEHFPELPAEVERRYDPVEAELRVAVALLNLELDRAWLAELSADEARAELERGPERLAEAAAIARASWPRRAASWQAAMTLGGATHLELYRGRDPRLMAESELWERPLLAAHRLAPAQPGPQRFLAAAQLGNWASLTGDERRAATDLLASAFQDRTTYRLLIVDWLRVAPTRAQALALVPERPWAWEALERIFANSGDWELVVRARQEWHDALASDLDRALAEVEVQLRGGERRLARRRLLQLLPGPPPSVDYAPRLQRLLELLPPGPVDSASAEHFGAWLEWAFEICLVSRCPFEAAVIGRLARLAQELPPSRRGLALLVANDLPRAELLERRFAQGRDDEWSAYYLLKAEHLAARQKPELARASLARVPLPWRRRLEYQRALLAVARAEGSGEAAATAALEHQRRSAWEGAAWEGAGDRHQLVLLPQAASGLSLEVESGLGRGGVVEVFWDGRLVGIRRVGRSRTTLEFDVPVTPELHRLSVRVRAGSRLRPAALLLRS